MRNSPFLLSFIPLYALSGCGNNPPPKDETADTVQSDTIAGGGDTAPPDGGPGPDSGSETIEDTVIFDKSLSAASGSPPFEEDLLHTFSLTVAESDLAWLESNAALEEYVPADLTFDDTPMGTVGLRYKGSNHALTDCYEDGLRVAVDWCAKLSMKIKFNAYVEDTRLFGLKRINLHGMRVDYSKLKERLAYKLFRDMGVKTSRATHARLVINEVYWGLYALVEQIDGRFTANRWPEAGDGNLYKEWWFNGNAALSYPSYMKTNNEEPDPSEYEELINLIANTPAEDFVSIISPHIEVEHMVRYMVVDRAIANVDGITRFYSSEAVTPESDGWVHNFYIYQQEAGGKFLVLPWDMDMTFEYPDAFVDVAGMPNWNYFPADCTANFLVWDGNSYAKPPACDPFIGGFVQSYWDDFVIEGNRFLTGPFQLERMLADLDRWQALITQAVEEDPDYNPDNWDWGLTTLRDALPNLITRFEQHLSEGVSFED